MAIFDENVQGSDGWAKCRAGIPTASEFSKIITPTGKEAKQPVYLRTKLAEWLTGGPVDDYQSKYMKDGNDLEGDARECYSFISDNKVKQIGFCYKDDNKLVGASVDGLIDDDGTTEIKCPKASTVVEYMLSGGMPLKYKPQVMGQLWILERDWCDFFIYHPSFKPIIISVERDEMYIIKLEKLVNEFIEEMLEKREQLKKYKDVE